MAMPPGPAPMIHAVVGTDMSAVVFLGFVLRRIVFNVKLIRLRNMYIQPFILHETPKLKCRILTRDR